ncbi:hypothetical protein BV898_13046 [Hypsibius exemplaris]|uniref:Uncharacterized protein n=1 Tax=Hypsibius exemplaris TaxID=2072580 RepID=A0A1W0WBY2_HYPEX|nr:hypothetical protein BV898_13046 [Hypsibius exemplaris]
MVNSVIYKLAGQLEQCEGVSIGVVGRVSYSANPAEHFQRMAMCRMATTQRAVLRLQKRPIDLQKISAQKTKSLCGYRSSASGAPTVLKRNSSWSSQNWFYKEKRPSLSSIAMDYSQDPSTRSLTPSLSRTPGKLTTEDLHDLINRGRSLYPKEDRYLTSMARSMSKRKIRMMDKTVEGINWTAVIMAISWAICVGATFVLYLYFKSEIKTTFLPERLALPPLDQKP